MIDDLADKGELVVIPPREGGNVVRALINLHNFPSHYLYVYRTLNPSVLEQLAKTRAAKAEYDQLLEQRVGVQVTFALMYAGVSLIFLLAGGVARPVVLRSARRADRQTARRSEGGVAWQSRCQGGRSSKVQAISRHSARPSTE